MYGNITMKPFVQLIYTNMNIVKFIDCWLAVNGGLLTNRCSFSSARGISSRELLYNIAGIVNNIVLYT
jgi:hypothetical protein